ncbi:apolipo protein O-domain-containing protein [Myxozyma melibiosi]|uniref:MICOS complex subunit n=1 Tax=Myxozyma melibiosi TaxID=54550 RepID=A0ABR1FC58_9ASCO
MAQQRVRSGLAIGAFGTALALSNIPVIHAETEKKPIYDDKPPVDPSPAATVIKEPPPVLESYVREGRLYLSKALSFAKVHLDIGMQKYLETESTVTRTVSELKSESEPLLPDLIYVLVLTLSTNIALRKRNILLRGVLGPAAVGTAAFAYFLPQTFENVGNLLWKFEVMAPSVADAHLKTKAAVVDTYHSALKIKSDSRAALDSTVSTTRKTIKDWTGLLVSEDEQEKK